MSANTCTASDILASVILCAEATVAPTVADWPAQFKNCDKTTLHGSGKGRMFRVVHNPSGGGEDGNTGTDSGTVQLVHRFIRFGLEVKFRRGKLTEDEFLGRIYADLYALGDRIQRRLAAHLNEVATGDLAGLEALDLDGEYAFSEDEPASAIYVVIPFKAVFTDDQVQL